MDSAESIQGKVTPTFIASLLIHFEGCLGCRRLKSPVRCQARWKKVAIGNVPVGCERCVQTRKHCTLQDLKWNVSKWPILVESTAGKARREEDRKASRLARGRRQSGDGVPESSKSTEPAPIPSPSIVQSYTESSVLADINLLSQRLQHSSSSSSSVVLACTLAGTRAARNQAASTHALISQRLKILDGLLARYDKILAKMEEDELSADASLQTLFVEGSSKDGDVVKQAKPGDQEGSEGDVEMEVLKEQQSAIEEEV